METKHEMKETNLSAAEIHKRCVYIFFFWSYC